MPQVQPKRKKRKEKKKENISQTLVEVQSRMKLVPLFFFFFLGLHPQHMEVPRLGVESELQLQAYSTATAILDQSCVCNLYHNSWQCWILNRLSQGIRPTFSWILLGFISAEPQRELQICPFFDWVVGFFDIELYEFAGTGKSLASVKSSLVLSC